MAYLNEIVAGRRRRVAAEGAELGEAVPERRGQPLVPLVPLPGGSAGGVGTGGARAPSGEWMRSPPESAGDGGRGSGGAPALASSRGGSGAAPLLVCEIKRRSPSRGAIAPGLDAVGQARRYADAGVRAVSVLTEPDHFGGALADLVAVKEACPHLSVLRKDFLLDERDLEVSYRAGADAVLLLAACLSTEELGRLYRRALELGMTPLVEVHDDADLARARAVRPLLTGINSRDLTTFEVDTTLPARLRPAVDWPTTLLFESGIQRAEDAAFARSAGFDGVLVGEAVVRRPELVAELHAVLSAPAVAGAGAEVHAPAAGACAGANAGAATGPASEAGTDATAGVRKGAGAGTGAAAGAAGEAGTDAATGAGRAGAGIAAGMAAGADEDAGAGAGAGPDVDAGAAATGARTARPRGVREPFWARVFAARHRLAGSGRPLTRPLIKVCGITNRADAELAVALGADLLGFILAPAPRRARPQAIRELADLPVLKVGVVVNDVSEALPLLRDGFLDALQLHGDEAPGECYEIAFPYYKAVRVGAPADLDAERAYRCPRVLLDAYSPAARGGTGRRVADDLLARRAAGDGARPLWLAGGMGPDNVAEVIRTHAPELIDASSRLEAEPGRKDHAKLRAFFGQVQDAWRQVAGTGARSSAGAAAAATGGTAQAAGAVQAPASAAPPGPAARGADPGGSPGAACPGRPRRNSGCVTTMIHPVPRAVGGAGSRTGDAEAAPPAAPAPAPSNTRRTV